MTKTVMFVHGAWLTPLAWNEWRAVFEAAGYETVAPTWPHMDRPIEALRRSPDPQLAKTSVVDIVDHYAAEITKLDEPPIIIGHSFGGLITLMLLDRGLGVAGGRTRQHATGRSCRDRIQRTDRADRDRSGEHRGRDPWLCLSRG